MNCIHRALLVSFARRGVLLLFACFGVAAVSAGERPLRQAKSEDGRFEFKVKPGRARSAADGENASKRARGTLSRKSEEKSDKLWTGPLVNELAPVHGFVSDGGRFVVTLNEAGRGGAAHAVAIYDERGRLKRELGLRDLLTREDWRRVKSRRNTIEWLGGARMKFVEDDKFFEIELRWGTRIRIDLAEAKMIDAPQPLDESELPEGIAAALNGTGDKSAEGETQDESFDPAALLAQLHDATPLEADELAALQVAMEKGELRLDPQSEAALAEALAAAIPNDYSDRPTAGNSRQTGVGVPAPDPAAPVDYIEWMNAQSITPEPNASTAYQAAMDSVEAFEGDDALYLRALDGDAEAIASPAIQEWLAKNQSAIEYIKEGNQLKYKGMPVQAGDDGMMVGIVLPHLGQMRLAAKTMAVQGKSLELGGDLAAAQNEYIEILKLGAQNGKGPTLIENLVGIAEQALGAERLLDSFESDVDGTVDYAALAQQLEQSYQPTRPMSETMQFERAFIMDVIQRGYQFDADTGSYRVSEPGLTQLSQVLGMAGERNPLNEVAMGMHLGTVGFERLQETANSFYDRMTHAAAAPFAASQAEFHAVQSEFDSPGFKAANPLLGSLLPALSRASELRTRSETNRNATLLVTNLMAYRQQHGSFPDSLEEFSGKSFVVDPFTSNPFVYRREGDDFVLYSTGPNGTDEGGVHDRRSTINDVRYWPRPPK